jgi:hypothetical protein
MALDVMGKWSLIDVYVLVMTMMAFRLEVLTPPYKVFPADFYTVHLQVCRSSDSSPCAYAFSGEQHVTLTRSSP